MKRIIELLTLFTVSAYGNICPDSWLHSGGFCLMNPTETKENNSTESIKLSWDDAEKYCANLGGNLASVTNDGVASSVSTICQGNSLNEKKCWIGLNDRTNPGQFAWSDKSEVQYLSFSNEHTPVGIDVTAPADDICIRDPTNEVCSASCVYLSSSEITMGQYACDAKLPFVCKMDAKLENGMYSIRLFTPKVTEKKLLIRELELYGSDDCKSAKIDLATAKFNTVATVKGNELYGTGNENENNRNFMPLYDGDLATPLLLECKNCLLDFTLSFNHKINVKCIKISTDLNQIGYSTSFDTVDMDSDLYILDVKYSGANRMATVRIPRASTNGFIVSTKEKVFDLVVPVANYPIHDIQSVQMRLIAGEKCIGTPASNTDSNDTPTVKPEYISYDNADTPSRNIFRSRLFSSLFSSPTTTAEEHEFSDANTKGLLIWKNISIKNSGIYRACLCIGSCDGGFWSRSTQVIVEGIKTEVAANVVANRSFDLAIHGLGLVEHNTILPFSVLKAVAEDQTCAMRGQIIKSQPTIFSSTKVSYTELLIEKPGNYKLCYCKNDCALSTSHFDFVRPILVGTVVNCPLRLKCINNGVCINYNEQTQCTCPKGYAGPTCEFHSALLIHDENGISYVDAYQLSLDGIQRHGLFPEPVALTSGDSRITGTIQNIETDEVLLLDPIIYQAAYITSLKFVPKTEENISYYNILMKYSGSRTLLSKAFVDSCVRIIHAPCEVETYSDPLGSGALIVDFSLIPFKNDDIFKLSERARTSKEFILKNNSKENGWIIPRKSKLDDDNSLTSRISQTFYNIINGSTQYLGLSQGEIVDRSVLSDIASVGTNIHSQQTENTIAASKIRETIKKKQDVHTSIYIIMSIFILIALVLGGILIQTWRKIVSKSKLQNSNSNIPFNNSKKGNRKYMDGLYCIDEEEETDKTQKTRQRNTSTQNNIDRKQGPESNRITPIPLGRHEPEDNDSDESPMTTQSRKPLVEDFSNI